MNLIEGTTFLILGLIITIYNFWNIQAIDLIYKGDSISASLNPTFALLLIVP